MMCIEDFCNFLKWAEKIGGISALIKRVEANYAVARKWISQQKVFRFLVDEKFRAHHIICLDLVSEKYQALSGKEKWDFLKRITTECAAAKIGFDILGHILTKPHLRIWAGPTIEAENLERLFEKLVPLTEDLLKTL